MPGTKVSSNGGGYFSRGQGKGQGNPPGTRGRTQHMRISQFQGGNASPLAKNLHPSEMVNPVKVFVRGMRLEGCGVDLGKETIYHQTGKGTLEDPIIAWLYEDNIIGYQSRQAHNRIARSVAQANNFQCILIRKGTHNRECTYNKYGRRNTFVTSDGRAQSVTTSSDNHMTVWMGEHVGRILVSGHIYVVKALDPKTGKQFPLPMNDPVNQRNKALIQPGRGLVSEEFWLTQNTWERFG